MDEVPATVTKFRRQMDEVTKYRRQMDEVTKYRIFDYKKIIFLKKRTYFLFYKNGSLFFVRITGRANEINTNIVALSDCLPVRS
jgi:hypothetical protein